MVATCYFAPRSKRGAALVLSRIAQEAWGDNGVLGVASIAGAVDADAVTLSMGRLSATDLSDLTAARAIVIAVVANTLFKVMLAISAGAPGFRKLVLLTGVLTVSAGAIAMFSAAAWGMT